MDYIELTLDAADAEQAKILTAELADFPFESFEQEGARLKAYIPRSGWPTAKAKWMRCWRVTASDAPPF